MAIIYRCCLNIIFLLLCRCSAQKTEKIGDICDTGATCATCFRELVNSAITPEQNQFEMQEAFFPPEVANPVYVVVHYSFIGREENVTWYWSQSQYYASFHPLPVYQLTSLFFGDFKFHTKELSLTLESDCFEAPEQYMRLLTQRLKLYAMKRSIYPGIDDSYEPKAESAATIKNYHTSTDIKASVWLLIGQVFIFPIVGIFIAFLIHYCTKLYILEDDTPLDDTPLDDTAHTGQSKAGDTPQGDNVGDTPQNKQGEDIEAKLSIIVTLSYMFSFYSVIMSLIAVIYAYHPNLQGLNEWYELIKAIRAIPFIMFIEDMIILVVLVSYTIILTCIRYKCIVLPFCDSSTVWKYSAYCAVFPGAHLAIHGFDIIIALIHNEVHATSVGVAYVALILINVYTLRALYKAKIVKFYHQCIMFFRVCCRLRNGDSKHNVVSKDDEKCCCSCCDAKCYRHFAVRIFLFCLVSLFITGVCGIIVAIYIILPINSAFDKASSSLRIIYSVTIFGFTIFVTYWLIKKKK